MLAIKEQNMALTRRGRMVGKLIGGGLAVAGGFFLVNSERLFPSAELEHLQDDKASLLATLNPAQEKLVKELSRSSVDLEEKNLRGQVDAGVVALYEKADQLADLDNKIDDASYPLLNGLGLVAVVGGGMVAMSGGIDLRMDDMQKQINTSLRRV
jgi:hypothetical protein